MKALYMTGYTADSMVQYGISDTGTALIQKPFSPQVIPLKIQEMLGRR